MSRFSTPLLLVCLALGVACAFGYDVNMAALPPMQPAPSSNHVKPTSILNDVRFMEETRQLNNAFAAPSLLEEGASTSRAQTMAAQQAAEAAQQAATIAALSKVRAENARLTAARLAMTDDDDTITDEETEDNVVTDGDESSSSDSGSDVPTHAPHDDALMDATDRKLAAAMAEAQMDLLNKGKDIKREAEWIQKVEEMIEEYREKIKNVHANMELEKQELKAILMKKHQVQNLQIQRALEKQLEEAEQQQEALNDQLEVVKTKSDEFAENKVTLTSTIDKIKEQLTALKGGEEVEAPEEEKEDPEAGEAAMLQKLQKTESTRLNSELRKLGVSV